MGRGQAQLLRRSVRRFSAEPVAPELIEAAVAEALTAPAPHHTRPVRFVWMADARPRRAAGSDEGQVASRSRRRRQGPRRRGTPGRPRPDPLRRTRTRHPVHGSRRCAQLPGRRTHRRRTHHVHRRRRARPCRGCSSPWRCAGWAAAGSDRRSSPRIWCAPNWICPTTGNRWAPSRSATPPSRWDRARPAPTEGLLVRK